MKLLESRQGEAGKWEKGKREEGEREENIFLLRVSLKKIKITINKMSASLIIILLQTRVYYK